MYKILIVDDNLENRKLLASIISENTGCDVMTAKSGQDIINRFESIENNPPDIILLDILMPKVNGFHIAQILKSRDTTHDIPIIFITALTNTKNKIKAFEAGGIDYISKPFHKEELLARVNTHLNIKGLHDELRLKTKILEQREVQLKDLLQQKSKTIESITSVMNKAQTISKTEHAQQALNQLHSLCEYSGLIAESMGCPKDFVRRIKICAAYCDAGEAGLPYGLLEKEGLFTEEERAVMKQHVVIGARMLDSREIDTMARDIALYHHEKWDGSGYIYGLKGENIPLEARIVRIVDAYCALTYTRPYRKTYKKEKALQIIRENKGKDFDPNIADAFLFLIQK
jgi:putative two-component system response regulator